RALHVGWAGDRRAIAALREIAGAGRGPARGSGRLESVGRAVAVGAVAGLGPVARPDGGAAERRALDVAGAGAGRARAGLGRVAGSDRRPADRGRRLEGVRRAGVVDAVARFGAIAHAGRPAAGRGALGVGWTIGRSAAAGLGDIARPGRRT